MDAGRRKVDLSGRGGLEVRPGFDGVHLSVGVPCRPDRGGSFEHDGRPARTECCVNRYNTPIDRSVDGLAGQAGKDGHRLEMPVGSTE